MYNTRTTQNLSRKRVSRSYETYVCLPFQMMLKYCERVAWFYQLIINPPQKTKQTKKTTKKNKLKKTKTSQWADVTTCNSAPITAERQTPRYGNPQKEEEKVNKYVEYILQALLAFRQSVNTLKHLIQSCLCFSTIIHFHLFFSCTTLLIWALTSCSVTSPQQQKYTYFQV